MSEEKFDRAVKDEIGNFYFLPENLNLRVRIDYDMLFSTTRAESRDHLFKELNYPEMRI